MSHDFSPKKLWGGFGRAAEEKSHGKWSLHFIYLDTNSNPYGQQQKQFVDSAKLNAKTKYV